MNDEFCGELGGECEIYVCEIVGSVFSGIWS